MRSTRPRSRAMTVRASMMARVSTTAPSARLAPQRASVDREPFDAVRRRVSACGRPANRPTMGARRRKKQRPTPATRPPVVAVRGSIASVVGVVPRPPIATKIRPSRPGTPQARRRRRRAPPRHATACVVYAEARHPKRVSARRAACVAPTRPSARLAGRVPPRTGRASVCAASAAARRMSRVSAPYGARVGRAKRAKTVRSGDSVGQIARSVPVAELAPKARNVPVAALAPRARRARTLGAVCVDCAGVRPTRRGLPSARRAGCAERGMAPVRAAPARRKARRDLRAIVCVACVAARRTARRQGRAAKTAPARPAIVCVASAGARPTEIMARDVRVVAASVKTATRARATACVVCARAARRRRTRTEPRVVAAGRVVGTGGDYPGDGARRLWLRRARGLRRSSCRGS